MTDRERLVELLWKCVDMDTPFGEIADYLISNGVTIPVRCKDCWKSGEGMCSYNFKNVPGKDFCGDGERKYNGKY